MQVIKEVSSLKEQRSSWTHPVGLVPTMGFLHEGHLSLVRRARAENATVVVTIFVNPTQFGPTEDLALYPRDMDRDLALLEHEGVHAVFAPPASEMYPEGYSTWVDMDGVTSLLEGALRPGHFRGVATVCNKLFNIAAPERAYFGQKDAQQVAVIKTMVQDLNMNLDIVVAPIVREPDGLAMSSRNAYLSPTERVAATVLCRALIAARSLRMGGCSDAGAIRTRMSDIVKEEPLATLEYATVVSPVSFKDLGSVEGSALAVIAVRIGSTRLIDNMLLD
ncbi:MAG: pantoate--beta-alanine ligase [Dehalococcoidia bacterium]|nr:pantoate--beta-alanine ligase [Dehalococcoidia bacterium]